MPIWNLQRAAALAVAAVLAAGGAGCNRPWPGGSDTDKRLTELETSQQALLKEVREIKALLQNRAPAAPKPPAAVSVPEGLELTVDATAFKGKPGARLAIVEYSDFECPFCGRYTRDTLPQIEKAYVETGMVRYAFRHFPLERLHPNAFRAAAAAECARAQGRFWEMHNRLFSHQTALREADMPAHAKAVGLDAARFQQCMAGPVMGTIRTEMDAPARAGVAGTPSFFIGVAKPDGKIRVLRMLSGALPFARFKTELDQLLASPDALK